jgi:hypothetical protein
LERLQGIDGHVVVCAEDGARDQAAGEDRAGPWVDRHWQTMPAELDSSYGMVSAKLPAATRVCYLNLFDAKDRVASSENLVVNEV